MASGGTGVPRPVVACAAVHADEQERDDERGYPSMIHACPSSHRIWGRMRAGWRIRASDGRTDVRNHIDVLSHPICRCYRAVPA